MRHFREEFTHVTPLVEVVRYGDVILYCGDVVRPGRGDKVGERAPAAHIYKVARGRGEGVCV
jgi:hypothetical protein